jgi:transcriptional regulator with XRE-family HTH domain
MTGPEFRDAMRALGINQLWLAGRLGVARITVNRWVSGTLAVPQYAVAYLDTLAELRRSQDALRIAAALLPELRGEALERKG